MQSRFPGIGNVYYTDTIIIFLNETVTHHHFIMYLQLLNIKYKSRMYRLRNYKQYKRLPTLGYEMTSFHVRQSGENFSKRLVE